MASKLTFSSPLRNLQGIGSNSFLRLEKAGLKTVRDLLYYFPFRYEDLSNSKPLNQLEIGEVATVTAQLWSITKFRSRTGKTIIKAVINDGRGTLDVIWFNQVYLLIALKPNQKINFSGKIGVFGKKLTLINPRYEILKEELSTPIHTQRIVPIYSETAGITAKWVRTKIHQVLNEEGLEIREFLPDKILKEENLPSLKKSLGYIHFPNSNIEAQKARERFVFEELFLLHLRNKKIKTEREIHSKTLPLELTEQEKQTFEKSLPFQLTQSQRKAIKEILTDISSSKPMNRLLQGEVGSGKTVVGCFALLAAVKQGYQAAFMAPTEILAKQHFQTINSFFGKDFKVQIVTGSQTLKSNDFDILIGTHALLNKTVQFKELGLVIIDEQQRFGVAQRTFLRSKGTHPHLLTMTATPIPRTLALTLYGDLEISVIDQLPSDRKKIKTYLVPLKKRSSAYNFLEKEIKSGGQAFIICPLIDPSETLQSVKSAKSEFEFLKDQVFKNLKLGLLHGQLKPTEKDSLLEKFRSGKLNILVSTPVVEVGIDVTDASIILIEGAERFGLSSLHQLRGRVGRGKRQSYCLLFTEKTEESILKRLQILEKSSNGLEIAELDLKLRGPGDLYGTVQHGLFELKLANNANLELILHAKTVAENIDLAKISQDLNQILEEKIDNNREVAPD